MNDARMILSGRIAAALALALPLAGCISFGDKPPPQLLNLTTTAPAPAGATATGSDKTAVLVAMPQVPQKLATQRLPVDSGPTAVSYLKDALWVEAPARLFRTLLADTIAQKTGRLVPDPRQFASAPDTRLTGRLADFGLDASRRAAVVTYDAALARSGSDELTTRRFQATVPVAAEDPQTVAAAINQAANQVAGEVADWIGR